jgi:hypothetical protein
VWAVRRQAKTEFELKAAEIVMNSYSPIAAKNRAKLLQSMFKRTLPRDFAERFDPNYFPGTRLYEMKMKLFEMLAQNPTKKEELISLWRKLFPEEERWFGRLYPSSSIPPSSPTS